MARRTHPNVLKLRKQLRNLPRSLSTQKIHVSRGMNISHIPEDAQPLFKRKYVTWEDSAFLKSIFPGRASPPASWNSEGVEKKFTMPDGSAIATNPGEKNGRYWTLQEKEALACLEYVEHAEACDFHTIEDSLMQQHRVSICFNRKKTVAYLVIVNYRDKTVAKSRVYGSYDRAMFLWQNCKKAIVWNDPLPLESLTLILPR